jgi:hypothetical protein
LGDKLLTGGITVDSKCVTFVIGDVHNDKVTIQADDTHHLHKGNRPAAYRLMRERLTQLFAASKIRKIVIKGSAIGHRSATKALLEAAELRGVCMSAVPDGIEIDVVDKGHVSRNYGSRKFDDYTSDDEYWNENFLGKTVRKGSRDAAFLLLVTRS